MPPRSPSLAARAVLIALVLVAGGVGAGLLYEVSQPKPASAAPTVSLGDNVTVDYIGLFGSGAEQGRVFDTSLFYVAENNLSWPKSLEYSGRNRSSYSPLAVHVGPDTPSGGYKVGNYTFIGVVTGFWQGLLGLPENGTRWATVPPGLGYGPALSTCFVYQPLLFSIAPVTTYTLVDFSRTFPGVTPSTGAQFVDPTFGWTDLIAVSNASAIVVQRLAVVGDTSSTSGWPVTVISVNSTAIELSNQLTPSDAGRIVGHSPGRSICSSTEFIISAVNSQSGVGNFTENYNREVVGQTLIFIVTIGRINPS